MTVVSFQCNTRLRLLHLLNKQTVETPNVHTMELEDLYLDYGSLATHVSIAHKAFWLSKRSKHRVNVLFRPVEIRKKNTFVYLVRDLLVVSHPKKTWLHRVFGSLRTRLFTKSKAMQELNRSIRITSHLQGMEIFHVNWSFASYTLRLCFKTSLI